MNYILTRLRLQDHVRKTLCRMCRVELVKDIGPHFVDEHGDPDTLPSHLFDPKTDYCQPCPHLTAPLDEQTAWVPTFLLRFRKTIPTGDSELSNALRALSDYDVLVLLHDGPFKSAQSSWKRQQNTDSDIEEMRAKARRYSRADRVSVCSCRQTM